jgi:hypothetical protein
VKRVVKAPKPLARCLDGCPYAVPERRKNLITGEEFDVHYCHGGPPQVAFQPQYDPENKRTSILPVGVSFPFVVEQTIGCALHPKNRRP